MKKLLTGILSIALFVACCGVSSKPVSAQKVSKDAGGITLTEGQSTSVNLRLDAPIICSGGAPECNVSLTFVSTDPNQVAVSPIPVVWNSTAWSEVRVLTITALDDGLYSTDRSITLRATAVSASLYFSGFVITIPVVVHNINPVPSPAISNKSIALATNTGTTVDVLTEIGGSPDTTTLTITAAANHGSASVSGNSIMYTPASDYNGVDTVTYRVCSTIDSSVCSTATITFTIKSPSVAPATGYGKPNDGQTIILPLMTAALITTAGIALWRRRTNA